MRSTFDRNIHYHMNRLPLAVSSSRITEVISLYIAGSSSACAP